MLPDNMPELLLGFYPADGLTFHVKGVYTDSLRSPVKEHANGKIEITRICGPVAKRTRLLLLPCVFIEWNG